MDHGVNIKTVEDNVDNPGDLGHGDVFLDTPPKAWFRKEIIEKWTSLKLKSSTLWKTMSRE